MGKGEPVSQGMSVSTETLNLHSLGGLRGKSRNNGVETTVTCKFQPSKLAKGRMGGLGRERVLRHCGCPSQTRQPLGGDVVGSKGWTSPFPTLRDSGRKQGAPHPPVVLRVWLTGTCSAHRRDGSLLVVFKHCIFFFYNFLKIFTTVKVVLCDRGQMPLMYPPFIATSKQS